jgi:hypothetical protein
MLRRLLYLTSSLVLAAALLVSVFYGIALAAQPHQADGQDYVIQRGDTLYKLAEQFYDNGNAWPTILEATNVKAQTDSSYDTITDTRRLRVGQKVWIPAQTGGQEGEAGQTPPPPTLVPTPEAWVTGTTDAQGEAASAAPGVRFVTPANGATVAPTFTVEMAANGLTVEPAGEIHEGAGHMHILVDTDLTPPGEVILNDAQHLHYGKGQLTATLALDPGVHVLHLQFANGAHIALDGDQYQDTITVTVANEAASAAPEVHFVTPVNGATVAPTFTVETAATGLTVEPAGDIHPDAGHMHVLVDTDFTPPGEVILRDAQHKHLYKGELTTTLGLDPGVHVLNLQFSDGAHVALDGDQYRDTITVTVAGEAADAVPGVHFVTPMNGATVAPTFTVEMAANGLTVEPAGEIHEDAGHMHILVDTDFTPPGEVILNDTQHLHYGKGQLTATLGLDPGMHVLHLQFANGAHIALDGDQYRDTITVTVAEQP